MPTATSQLTNDSGYITAGEAPVQSVNNKTGTVTLSASDIGAETPSGAQAKADAALAAANTYTDQEVGAVSQTVNAHLADYTLQVPFGGTTTNSGNNYSIATPAISSLTAGMAIAVKINADSTGACTLNWNGKGAKPIKKANGTNVTNLKAGGIYTLRYDGTNFILQGEGASGNATASDLLSGKTATTDAGEIVGTMPNRGAVANTITTQGGQYTIPAGYHSGSGKVTASFANLVAGNVKKDVNIGGVIGTLLPGQSASGTVTSSSSGLSFMRANYKTQSRAYVTVSGLTFLPKMIIVSLSGSTTLASYTIFSAIVLGNVDGGYTNISNADDIYLTTGNLVVSSTGFTLPVQNTSAQYNWYAIG
jgi:hypothetical protein